MTGNTIITLIQLYPSWTVLPYSTDSLREANTKTKMEISLPSGPGTDTGSDVTSGVESISSAVGAVADVETEEGLCVCGCGGSY